MKKSFILFAICLIILLSGCSSDEIKVDIDTEDINEDGSINCEINNYKPETHGFIELVDILRQCTDSEMPQTLTIARFDGKLNRKGVVEDFLFSVYAYNESCEYVGLYHFRYVHSDGLLYVTEPEADNISGSSTPYNANNDLKFLDSQIKRLQLEQQISLLDFPEYVISFTGISMVEKDNPIMNGRNGHEFPILTFEEYENCEGGISDGKWAVEFQLYDGVSVISENSMYYICDYADKDTLHSDYIMECDYYVNDNKIYFTRDYGETWIEADISEEDMAETLAINYNGAIIPEDSYSINTNSDTIAFIYGEKPRLRISFDIGETWEDRTFDLEKFYFLSINKRIVHFFNQNNGYVGLGTSWSMGTGEMKYCMMTNDGGLTWQEKQLPENVSSNILTGLYFIDADMEAGAVSLRHQDDDLCYPKLYLTVDGGENWVEITTDWEQIPTEPHNLQKLYSLSIVDGEYVMVIGSKNFRFKLSSTSLDGQWSYVEEVDIAG